MQNLFLLFSVVGFLGCSTVPVQEYLPPESPKAPVYDLLVEFGPNQLIKSPKNQIKSSLSQASKITDSCRPPQCPTDWHRLFAGYDLVGGKTAKAQNGTTDFLFYGGSAEKPELIALWEQGSLAAAFRIVASDSQIFLKDLQKQGHLLYFVFDQSEKDHFIGYDLEAQEIIWRE
ncbi:MAG: hypothetical protein AB7O96_04485 [Pseudobdellovibrionaceae bacterium]